MPRGWGATARGRATRRSAPVVLVVQRQVIEAERPVSRLAVMATSAGITSRGGAIGSRRSISRTRSTWLA